MGLFKKIGKTLNKGVDTIKDTATDATKAVADTAQDVANQAGDVAVKVGQDAAALAVDTFTSSIVIRNQSPVRPWQCALTPNQEALKITGIAFQALASSLMAVSLFGAAGLGLSAAGIAMTVTPNSNGYTVGGPMTSTISTINNFAQKLTGQLNPPSLDGAAKSLTDVINLNPQPDFRKIAPGASTSFDKLTLSLLQQAVCFSAYPNPSNPQMIMADILTMTPLWSGATGGSSNGYSIQTWEKDAKTIVIQFNLNSTDTKAR